MLSNTIYIWFYLGLVCLAMVLNLIRDGYFVHWVNKAADNIHNKAFKVFHCLQGEVEHLLRLILSPPRL